MPVAEHVKEQERRNEEAARKQQAEMKRKQTIRTTAKKLRDQSKEAAKANAATRKQIAEYKDVCGADLLELEAEHAATVAEGKELAEKLAALRRLTGVV